MKPGRELDALVAEKVMGWSKEVTHHPSAIDGWYGYDTTSFTPPWQARSQRVPDYSTDIAAAWEVFEKCGFEIIENYGPLKRWAVYATRADFHVHDSLGGSLTAPHAICLAALKSVGAL